MIFGAYDSRDLAAATLADYTQERAAEDLRRFANRYQENLRLILREIAVFDWIAKTTFGMSVTGELQVEGEYSQGVEATRIEGEWDVAFPIGRFGDRTIWTKEYLARATLEQLEKDTLKAAVHDATTMRKIVLRALLKKANYTFVDQKNFPGVGLGSLTIRRLFNNDSATGEVPDLDGNAVSIGTLQHYYGTNTTTWANSFFTAMRAKLEAVGLGEDLVVWISRSNRDSVTGLTGFVDPANRLIQEGGGSTVRSATIRSPQAIGRMDSDSGDMEVQIMPGMPAGYMFAYDRADAAPVLIRETREPQFRGFRLTEDESRQQYDSEPIRNKKWERIAGAGVRNRRNGVAVQVVASTTYTDPTTI